MSDQLHLPEAELKRIREAVQKHIKSLNQAGTIAENAENLSTETLLQILGVKPGDTRAVDQWLCGCDSECHQDS